jgi:hypothetical protein
VAVEFAPAVSCPHPDDAVHLTRRRDANRAPPTSRV